MRINATDHSFEHDGGQRQSIKCPLEKYAYSMAFMHASVSGEISVGLQGARVNSCMMRQSAFFVASFSWATQHIQRPILDLPSQWSDVEGVRYHTNTSACGLPTGFSVVLCEGLNALVSKAREPRYDGFSHVHVEEASF